MKITYVGCGVNVSELHLQLRTESDALQLLETAPKLKAFVEQFDDLKLRFGFPARASFDPYGSKLLDLANATMPSEFELSYTTSILRLLFQVQENLPLVGVVDDNGNEFLMIGPKHPWEMTQAESQLSREQFNAMLRKYLGPLTSQPDAHIEATDLALSVSA